MKKYTASLKVILTLGLIITTCLCRAQVKVTEEVITIPTYIKGNPNPMPRFFEQRGHQGVQRRIYPYPMDNMLTNIKGEKDYPIIHIENDYIDIGVMPEAGGRVYYAEDKTNNYNFFYRNHVIKPSLIGMVGDWRSGSLGWGFPHHHGPNTVKPMDYIIQKNDDESVTVWVQDIDQRHRMTVLIGYTIYPNSSIIEMSIRPMNRTAVSNSFLFWANPAVNVDTTYQVIFPPSVQYATYHAKREMVTWPIADSIYMNYDFTGLDISMWKNTMVPTSFFSWEPKEGYFGGYNHGKQAGVAWVGNRYISPGMKYWADGNNPAGRKINNGLTDNDGQYLELMAGMYTDNQPDYSWIEPYESKTGTMIWFPIRELGGLKYANRNGALNYDITNNNSLEVRFNTTSPHDRAIVSIKSKDKSIFNKAISISPATPYKVVIPLPSGTSEDDLEILLLDQNEVTLLSYEPSEHHPPKASKPKPLEPLPSPKEIKTVEELYLAGLRLNQFYNPSVDPMPYYKEALIRDPGDYRTNTQLGILSIKNLDWAKAETYLRIAVERITANYTRPKDGEALYYLGLALKEQGKNDEAYEYLYQATWCNGWKTASYYLLAEIDCQLGNFEQALEHLDMSLLTTSDNLKALNLKTVVLRNLNRTEAARQVALNTLKFNTLDHQARNELIMLNYEGEPNDQSLQGLKDLTRIMRDDVQSYIELAADYGNPGFHREAIAILNRLEAKGNNYPMLYYLLGYYWSKEGNQEKALQYCQLANTMPYEYCFPFKAEELVALLQAVNINPNDSHAYYYLGNLYYELQPSKAIDAWEKSRQLDNSFYIVHRNLGIAYKEVLKDNAKALTSMNQALACNGDDPRLIFEIDELLNINNATPKEKYEFLKKNFKTAEKSSESLLRVATRAVEYGKYDEAISILASNSIVEAEGARELQTDFLDAHTLRALDYIKKGNNDKAINDLESNLAYPMGLNGLSRLAQFYYLKGLALEKCKKMVEAENFYKKALEVKIGDSAPDLEYNYYHGMALDRLGKKTEAKQVFNKMLSDVKEKGEASAFFTQFERSQSRNLQKARDHYLSGLAYEGLGEKDKARTEYNTALELNPGHIWSKVHLESL